jgi:hypothetical protein
MLKVPNFTKLAKTMKIPEEKVKKKVRNVNAKQANQVTVARDL